MHIYTLARIIQYLCLPAAKRVKYSSSFWMVWKMFSDSKWPGCIHHQHASTKSHTCMECIVNTFQNNNGHVWKSRAKMSSAENSRWPSHVKPFLCKYSLPDIGTFLFKLSKELTTRAVLLQWWCIQQVSADSHGSISFAIQCSRNAHYLLPNQSVYVDNMRLA